MSPPTLSTPPMTIFSHSSNTDVRIWIYHCIKKHHTFLLNDEAWALAKRGIGKGDTALRYTKEDWDHQVPGWGVIIDIELRLSRGYVVNLKIKAFSRSYLNNLPVIIGGNNF